MSPKNGALKIRLQMMTADDDVQRQKFALRELFRSYNNADPEIVKAQVEILVARLGWASGIAIDEEVELVDDEVTAGDREVIIV